MPNRPKDQATERSRGGFTLAEMMVAVGILIVVIAATAKIFGTVSKVTGIGMAGADVLQEVAAIERQIRADFERLAPSGFFAIRCVAVTNDVNLAGRGGLLNPSLPPDALVRADQLVFFTTGVQSIQTFRQGAGSSRKGQGTAARVYYGHAFQVPDGPAVVLDPADPDDPDFVWAIDPQVVPGNPLVPWLVGSHDFVRTRFQKKATDLPGDYAIDGPYRGGSVVVTQPPARQWLLARQAVVLADDGDNAAVYLAPLPQYKGVRTGRSIFIDDPVYGPVPEVRNGRVDAAASQLNEIRRFITLALVGGSCQPRPWLDATFTDSDGFGDQRSRIGGLLVYPRGERIAPGMHRVDQALTNHVLAGACSSLVIDWTYEDGVGDVDLNDDGIPEFIGVQSDSDAELPWFGLDAVGDQAVSRGVLTFSDYVLGLPVPPATIFPGNVEQYGPPDTPEGQAIERAGAFAVYEAFFGYNQDTPLNPATGQPWSTAPSMVAYTPWPTAIRITMTLHDTDTRLETGREIQFVIDLPRRVN